MARPSSHRVATLHMAGLFEPPPAMMAATDRAREIRKTFANARAWLKEAPSKLKRLKGGQSIRVWIGDPIAQKGVGIGIKRLDIWGGDDEPFVMGWSDEGKKRIRYPTEDEIYDGEAIQADTFEEAMENLEDSVEDTIKTWERKIPYLRKPGKLKDKALVEIHLLRREALKYFKGSKPREIKTVTKAVFPVDLTGWKYLQEGVEDLGGLTGVNNKIDERNADRQKEIDKGEKNLEAAQRLYKALQQPDLKDDPRTNEWAIFRWNREFFEDTESKGFWTTQKVLQNLPKEPKEAYAYDFTYLYRYRPVAEVAKQMEERLTKGDVATILDARNFTEVTFELWFKDHTTRGGVWKLQDRLLQVDVSNPQARSVATFQQGLFKIQRTLRHELQHVGQDALRIVLGLKEDAGLPPASVREDRVSPGKSRGWGKEPKEHPLRVQEFQTDLYDEIDRFERYVRKVPKPEWREYLRDYVGVNVGPRTGRHFKVWRQKNPAKWRKAVKEFTAEIQRRGIQIPAESSDIGSPVDVPAPDLFDDLQKKVARKAMGKPHHA